MGPARALVIHGHFYQPPRENPWLEAVEVQDSAAPYHDWNERITAQCYAPNTAARRVDRANRILDIVDNFGAISFNVGPTLFAWLDRHAPRVARAIVEADRASVTARGGHGNALAQVYNHQIMPLASRADKVTQVRWGLEDFRQRFGREAEGMWLPETAADDETLEVLAEAGVRFTILAPGQAWRVRPLDDDGGAWEEVNHAIDPSRPYLWHGPRGLGLTIFFYDAPISRAIAFEHVLESSERFVARLKAGFSAERQWPQLVHCATDGESYGHHSRFGEMALAAALAALAADETVEVTNYGAFLAAHPPTHEVQIRQATSWSCAHGVERWRADCGCRVRGDWQQRWRGPLREALDWLRDQVDPFYETRARAYLTDPWQARDDYVRVVLDRTRLDDFLGAHQRTPLDAAARLETRRLLELQRNRLLMYTSCGWFFDEISGLEPVQILRYAAMTLQYLRDLGGGNHEAEFEKRLAAAPSNIVDYGDGAEVYRRLVAPAIVDLRRVVAHYAITGLFEDYPDDAVVYAYRVRRLDEVRETYGGTALRIAHVGVQSEITGEALDVMYALVHFGGHDFACAMRAWEGRADYDQIKEDLLRRYARYSLADIVRGLDSYFPGQPLALPHLFLDERRRVLARVIASVLEKHEETYRQIWEDNRKLVRYLRQADAPIPDALAIVARHVLEQEALGALDRLSQPGPLPERVLELAHEAAVLGLPLDLAPAKPSLQRTVQRALDAVATEPSADRVADARRLVEDARALKLRFGLWAAQNRFFEIWQAHPEAREELAPLGAALGFNLTGEQA